MNEDPVRLIIEGTDYLSEFYICRVEGESESFRKTPKDLATYLSSLWADRVRVDVSIDGKKFGCVNSNQYHALEAGRLDAFLNNNN